MTNTAVLALVLTALCVGLTAGIAMGLSLANASRPLVEPEREQPPEPKQPKFLVPRVDELEYPDPNDAAARWQQRHANISKTRPVRELES